MQVHIAAMPGRSANILLTCTAFSTCASRRCVVAESASCGEQGEQGVHGRQEKVSRCCAALTKAWPEISKPQSKPGCASATCGKDHNHHSTMHGITQKLKTQRFTSLEFLKTERHNTSVCACECVSG